MKKITSIFLSLLSVVLLNAQSVLTVEYERISTGNASEITSGSFDNLPEHIKKQLIESRKNEASKKSSYTLFYSDGNAFFSDFIKEEKQEIAKNTEEETPNRKVISTVGRVIIPTKIYYKKGEKGNYRYSKSFGEEYYEYTEPNWTSIEYKDDTQKIDSFECKLVEITDGKNRTYKVWYTEQLPISAGPFNFHSLPGLVLKIEAPSYTLYAIKVSNDAKPSDVEVLNPKLKIYKGEELEKKKQELAKPKIIRKEIRL